MNEPRFLPLSTYQELDPDVMRQRVDAFEAHFSMIDRGTGRSEN